MWVRAAGEKCDGRHHGFRGLVKPQGGQRGGQGQISVTDQVETQENEYIKHLVNAKSQMSTSVTITPMC